MQLTIVQKLAVAILGLTLVVLLATLGLARWSFERGFLDYVTALEGARLRQVPEAIAQEYVEAGRSWSSFTPQRLETLIRNSRPTDWSDERASDRRQSLPDDPQASNQADLIPDQGLQTDGAFRGRPDPPTAVYDVSGQIVVGDDLTSLGGEILSLPILVDGSVIGELRSVFLRRLDSPQETAFAAQQLQASWMIGGACLLLAIILSFLLAGALLAPLRRMISNVNQLSQGDYSVRMGENRTDELGQLMSDLDGLASILEEARSSRRRWFADISHELRTPITVLSGELEALQHGMRNFDENQVDLLSQDVQRLRHLVDDLYELAVSDVGGLKYEFSSMDLGSLVEDNVKGLRSRFAEQGMEITLKNTSVWVNADRNRLDQLLQNLLSNSLDYTDAPGLIDIALTESKEAAVLTIQDTPPGVTQAECERILNPLFRLDSSRSRRTGGAGLGLAICHNIVKAHKGTISASPSSLGGLVIRIEFPRTKTI